MFADSFPLLVKPASCACNLRCAHCFYPQDKKKQGNIKNLRMTRQTLKTLVKSYLAIPLKRHVFIWQGGEPTLMGLDFFAHAFALQSKYKSQGTIIENCLQTNGTLLSKDFSKLLARHEVLVGLSIDGPQSLHDFYRVYPSNAGSHTKVMQSLHSMNQNGVRVNSLTLLTSHNVGKVVDIFTHLRRKNILFQQYIPCVEFDADGKPCPWTVQALPWGKALCDLFDMWLAEQGRVSVRYFDALLYTIITGKSGICHTDTKCGQYAVVEHNGDIYPCDFFVSNQWKLGNIHNTAWPAVWQHPTYMAFRQAKNILADTCSACEWVYLCAGDCPKHRGHFTNTFHTTCSWLCEGYRIFFAHAVPILTALAHTTNAAKTY